jgi:AraC-like DNA-binding protein
MPELLFAFDEQNYRSCQDGFRGERDQEYYSGDYSIEAGSIIDVRAEKKAVGPSSIIRMRARTRQFFRRTWSHIRKDAIDVSVLWFVKRGRLCVSNQSGYKAAGAGNFVITRSMTPFFIECQTDEDRVHEVLHVTIPTHILRSFIPDDIRTGFAVPTDRREFAIAEHILVDILESDDRLSEQSAQLLLESALTLLGHAISGCDTGVPARQTVSSRRLHDVLRFIEVHLSDPNLSTMMVAKGCGISPRYLSFLLRLHGTSFSTLVWEQRLQKAKNWLCSTRADEVSISEVAYSMGFKSPAHFSRMFKRVFKLNPREYRANAPQQAQPRPPQLYAEGGNLLQ